MQKIFYEKWIDLSHHLKELVSLTVDESINYKIETNGVRAVGNLIIKGEYISDEEKLFVENVELDILATYEKIIDQRDFNLKVEDFDYEIVDGNLNVKIEVGVHGVKDGENRYIKEEREADTFDEIESLSRTLETVSQGQSFEPIKVEEPVEVNRVGVQEPLEIQEEEALPVSQVEETVYPTKKRDNQEQEIDDEDVGTYYLYVVNNNDSYQSIAQRYQTDENIIRQYNQGIVLESGQVIIIPYVTAKNS